MGVFVGKPKGKRRGVYGVFVGKPKEKRRGVYGVFVAKPKGKYPLRKINCRREDNIKCSFKE